MTDHLERAREDVRRASDVTDDETVREQLRSIDEGLKEITHSSAEASLDTDRSDERSRTTTEGDDPHGGDLKDVEAKLAGLGDDVEGTPRALVQDARDRIDDYRRQVTRDW